MKRKQKTRAAKKAGSARKDAQRASDKPESCNRLNRFVSDGSDMTIILKEDFEKMQRAKQQKGKGDGQ